MINNKDLTFASKYFILHKTEPGKFCIINDDGCVLDENLNTIFLDSDIMQLSMKNNGDIILSPAIEDNSYHLNYVPDFNEIYSADFKGRRR